MSQIDKPKLKVSRRGLELIKSFEGFRPRAERLADGRWVVGHGHTLSAREGATVDATEAELLLHYDLLPILNAISERVALPLNPHQVDALASFGLALGLELVVVADNENGEDEIEGEATTADAPGEPAPQPQPPAATIMAMQRYSPYAVQGGAVFQPFMEPPAPQTDGPGDGVLILTPPPEVEPEPPTREVWPESARPGAVVDEEPLFIEDPAVRAGGQPVFMPESFEPERGRMDWSETGAFLGMGAVGLTAFGAAVVGFTMAADRPVDYGVDQTTVASGVLALIGALCVGISAYNLYLHWARRGDD